MTEEEFIKNIMEYAYRMAGEGISYNDGEIVLDPEDIFFKFCGGKSKDQLPSYFSEQMRSDWEGI